MTAVSFFRSPPRRKPGWSPFSLPLAWLGFLLMGLLAPAAAAVTYTYTVQGTRGLVLQTGGSRPLVWAQCNEGLSGAKCTTGTVAAAYTFSGAASQATTQNSASYLGYTDWRVPTKAELESLVKINETLPFIDTTAFPSEQGGIIGHPR